ncbi:hypothetical protein BpHYR1_045044 [Brachionus plicatilis]|uniref:Uncharacterized protein n=1 Tax=Brachionus plicatilis TaxID=10195 RepID=A0A3M7QKQ0_BRAPC|nr:hypothetical protein BpHYR1_045044 [Brachionus plicatilis]
MLLTNTYKSNSNPKNLKKEFIRYRILRQIQRKNKFFKSNYLTCHVKKLTLKKLTLVNEKNYKIKSNLKETLVSICLTSLMSMFASTIFSQFTLIKHFPSSAKNKLSKMGVLPDAENPAYFIESC